MKSFISSPRGTRPAVMITTAFLVLLAGCSADEEPPADSAVAAAVPAPMAGAIVLDEQDVVAARFENIGAAITLSGPLHPKEQVTLRAQVPGTVAELRVDRGSNVSRGQRLATIRAAGIQSQAAGARAGVAAAQANLAVARQRLDGARRLHEAGAMSDIDFRSAQAGYEAAEAQVAAARAQATSAGEAAGYTAIVAPISGTISARKVQEGEAVNPGGELLTIVNSRVLELSGQISVDDAARVRVGQAVTFSLNSGETYRGRVARIDPTADPGTRQVSVFVELPNPGGRIIGGQFARGSIAMATQRALVVPTSAVRGASGEGAAAYVFILENGKVVQRAVQVGARDEATGRVAILSGLAEGDRVIASPTSDMAPGTTVTMAAGDRAAAGAPAPGPATKEAP